jgi:hypothetical protein
MTLVQRHLLQSGGLGDFTGWLCRLVVASLTSVALVAPALADQQFASVDA